MRIGGVLIAGSVSASEAARDQSGSDRLSGTPGGERSGHSPSDRSRTRCGPNRCESTFNAIGIHSNKERRTSRMQEFWPLRGVSQDQRWRVEPDRFALQPARISEDRSSVRGEGERIEITHGWHQIYAVRNSDSVRGDRSTRSWMRCEYHRHCKNLSRAMQHSECRR
jgi:hypothetical protein